MKALFRWSPSAYPIFSDYLSAFIRRELEAVFLTAEGG